MSNLTLDEIGRQVHEMIDRNRQYESEKAYVPPFTAKHYRNVKICGAVIIALQIVVAILTTLNAIH